MKSKLEQLIAELCPDGVEFKLLNTFCKVYDGTHQTPTYTDSGIKFVSVENINDLYNTKKFISENDFAKFKVIPQINDVMMTRIGSIGVCSVIESNEPLAYYVSLALLRPNNKIVNSRYLKYIIESKHGRKELRKRTLVNAVPIKVNTGDIGMIKLPVPPLEVQREIVRVLDNFTFLTAELTAELTARRKQYEYYRDKLLTLDSSIPEYSMGDLLTFLNGRAYKQQELLSSGKYPVLRVGNFYTNSSWYYSDLELENNKYCDKGDLLYSWAATLGPKIWDGERCIYHYHIWKIQFDEKIIDKMYLYYYLQYDLSEISKSTTHSTMVHVSMGSMKERKIKIPSLIEQRRIASIISHFDNMCTSISSGLPAEIEARRNQYEYYRDWLLTFKEVT